MLYRQRCAPGGMLRPPHPLRATFGVQLTPAMQAKSRQLPRARVWAPSLLILVTYSRILGGPSRTLSAPLHCLALWAQAVDGQGVQGTSHHGSGPAARTHAQGRAQVSAGSPTWSDGSRGPLTL